MSMKPYLFAAALAIVLGVGSAPAEAQFYGGGSYISVGGPMVLTPTTVVAPVRTYAYDPFLVPTSRVVVQSAPVVTSVNRVVVQQSPVFAPVNRVIVQPAPIIAPFPYQTYRPGWGPRPFPLGRRGWW